MTPLTRQAGAPAPARPSDWIVRWSHLIAPGASVLDVACGSGRHTRWLSARGHRVTAIDRDPLATQGLDAFAELVLADIEAGPWPLAGRRFDAIVVTNYLWRPLFPTLVESLAPGGVLFYETFAQGQARWGKPSNPAFLLEPGELLRQTQALRTVAYEDGFLDGPPRLVQRLLAIREQPNPIDPPRHALLASSPVCDR